MTQAAQLNAVYDTLAKDVIRSHDLIVYPANKGSH